jgi:hypothetical protein
VLKLLADENFNHQIVTGLRRRLPNIDIVTVREVRREGALDPVLLSWAAKDGRVVVTHDTRTMAGYAYERIATGKAMPGVLEVPDRLSVGRALEELLLIVQLMEPHEIRDRVLRLPL